MARKLFGSLEDLAAWQQNIRGMSTTRQPQASVLAGGDFNGEERSVSASWRTYSARRPSCREPGCPFERTTKRRIQQHEELVQPTDFDCLVCRALWKNVLIMHCSKKKTHRNIGNFEGNEVAR